MMAESRIEIFNPSGLSAPLGLYKHVSRAKGSEIVHVAGQLSVNEAGEVVGANDFESQMVQVFDNLRVALASVEAGFEHVARFTTYLVRPSDIDAFMRVRERLFPGLFPGGAYPPNTLLVVQRLVRPEFLIEVDTVVVR